MKKGQAARTAQLVAFARAIESRRGARERLFEDPLAARFLGRDGRWMLSVLGVPGGARALMAVIDAVAPGQYGYGVGRTAYIDEMLEASLKRGVPQVVILGAGYDSRAFRIPGVERARVFEVDHPDTQAVKREHLADLLEPAPEHVTFVGVDFERQQLADRLQASGFSFERASFFIWEGVTHYLEAPAVDATLKTIVRAAPGSELVFTYLDRGLLDGTKSFPGGRRVLRATRRFGEPFRFGLVPEEAPDFLRDRGLALLEDLGGDDLTTRFFEPRGRSDRAARIEHVALARVAPR